MKRRPNIKYKKRAAIVCNHNYICWWCKKPFEYMHEVDIHHVQPLSLGGDDSKRNLVPVHKECHKKADIYAMEEHR